MLARFHRSIRNKDEGFTLIELLVVMIIIGILAAIAVPVFLTQRQKARDTATKSDVTVVGKEIASYFVDGANSLTAAQAGGAGTAITLTETNSGTFTTSINVSAGTTLGTGVAGFTSAPTATTWCISLVNSATGSAAYKYSASGGLVKGVCP